MIIWMPMRIPHFVIRTLIVVAVVSTEGGYRPPVYREDGTVIG